MADNVSAVGSLNYVSSSNSSSTGGYTVDTETFFKLLVAQMQYQDPLEPQDNSEFLAELAQMTTQEQMQSMNGTLNVSKALSMVGKAVYAEALDSDTGITNYYEGVVDSVVMKDGTAYVVVDGNAIPIDKVLAVGDASAADSSEASDSSDTSDSL